MMILSALFGIGVGAFRGLVRPDTLASQQISDALRSARLFARTEGGTATVVVSPAAQTVTAVGLRRVGVWHFEGEDGFGWPKPLLHEGATIVSAGVIGSCLLVQAETVVTLQDPPPSFDSPYGFAAELALAPARGMRPMTLLERAGVWRLELDRDDELAVVLQLMGEQGATSEYRHQVPGAGLSADRFTHVSVMFDGRVLQVSVDGVRAGPDTLFDTPRRLVVNSRVSLTTGRPPNHFQGRLDELHLSAVIRAAAGELPSEVELVGPERLIHIDAHGRLDPVWHRAPVQVAFLAGDPPRRNVVELGLLGTVRHFSEEIAVAGSAPGAADATLTDEDSGEPRR